jgi:uncharacterized membrane protein
MDDNDFGMMVMMTFLLGGALSLATLEYSFRAFIATLGFVAFIILVLFIKYIADTSTEETLLNNETQENSAVNPVKELQEQYAKGNLSEEEFEDRLDTIVETQELAEQIDDEQMDLLDQTNN